MAGVWESDAVQAIGKQYAELAAAGAPSDVLQNLHNRAEALRKTEGYSGGHDGSKVLDITQPSSSGRTSNDKITVIGSAEDFDSSSYDFKPSADYSVSSGSSGSLDGGTIAGYVITAIVLVVVLDKLLG